MPKYTVYAVIDCTKTIGTFEANSKEEALKLAQKSENYYVNSLCRYCAKNYELGEIIDTIIEEDE